MQFFLGRGWTAFEYIGRLGWRGGVMPGHIDIFIFLPFRHITDVIRRGLHLKQSAGAEFLNEVFQKFTNGFVKF